MGHRFEQLVVRQEALYVSSRVGPSMPSPLMLAVAAVGLAAAFRSDPPKQEISVDLNDDGSLSFKSQDGELLQGSVIKKAKKERRNAIERWLQEEAEKRNAALEIMGRTHLEVRTPEKVTKFTARKFEEPPPKEPKAAEASWLSSRQDRRRLQSNNEAALAAHEANMRSWLERRRVFEEREWKLVQAWEKQNDDIDAARLILERTLSDIEWPFQTEAQVEILNEGRTLFLDVDLPEIEDLPEVRWDLDPKALCLVSRPIKGRARSKLYADYIHAIAFRLIGDVFAVFPRCDEVVVSGYTQRPDPQKGHTDDYVISVRASRDSWQGIKLGSLENVEPSQALERFDLRRKYAWNGIMNRIAPFWPNDLV